MKLLKISHSGLKAADAVHDLGDEPVAAFLGPNGAGKSTVIDALHLLARGRAPGLPATADGVMRLARGDAIEVIGAFVLDDGTTTSVVRSWTREADGKVSEAIDVGALGRAKTLRDRQGLLSAHLGAFAEAWTPGELLALSATELRKRLLALGAYDGDLAKWVPADCPTWARPHGAPLVHDWIADVVGRAKERVRDAQTEKRNLARRIEGTVDEGAGDLADAPGSTVDLAPLRKAIEDVAAERDALIVDGAEARAVRKAAEEQLATLETRATRLRLRLVEPAPDVAAAHQAYEEALRAHERAEERARLSAEVDGGKRRVEALSREIDAILVPSSTDHARAVADEELARAERMLCEARQAAEQITARANTLGDLTMASDVVGDTLCAECVDRLRTLAKEARSAADVAWGEHEEKLVDRNAARADLEDAQEGVRRAGLEAQLADARRALAELEAALAGLGAAEPTLSIAAAKAAIRDAEEQVRLRTELAEVEADIEAWRQDLADAPAPAAIDTADVDRRLAELKAALQAAEARNARAQERAGVLLAIQDAEEEEARAKRWVERFERLSEEILGATIAPLTERLTTIVGQPVHVRLVDARGGATCRIEVGEVDVSTLSGGERARFLAALVVAVAGSSRAPWKPVLVDAVEAISAEHRPVFLAALRDAVRAGQVSQAIVAGCPDLHIEVEGVRMINLALGAPDASSSTNGTTKKRAGNREEARR